MPLKIIQGSENAPLTPLIGCTVAVIGFGNQGTAHALNLRDSGIRVIVGSDGTSGGDHRARLHNFTTHSIAIATQQSDLVILALPDESQPQVFQKSIRPHLRPGATIGFLHGFSIRYGLIKPSIDVGVIMVAPKGPGKTLRDRFTHGQGIPCLFALLQDSPGKNSEAIGLAWANGIGCARAGIIFTTFANETDTDLFGEQAVLCGGLTQLIMTAFETLVNAGYPPELAYLECCHEVKQIADLVYERGLAGMMQAISNTAEFGAYQTGSVIVDQQVRTNMQNVLTKIQTGEFASHLIADHSKGFEWFHQQRNALRQHPIESAGKIIRSLMPWLNDQKESHNF